jgi:Holliday junction resolvase RusA-like endonuclease
MPNWTELVCRVDGRAPTTDPRPAHRWKHLVARAAEANWPGGRLHEPVGVEIRFDCLETDFSRVALRNLLKPTIDGLAAVVFERELSSNEWAYEDWRIFRLTVIKSVAMAPAVWIRMYPLGSTLQDSDSRAIFVPGVPRPGETAEEKAWAAAIEHRIGGANWPAITAPVAIGLRFVLPALELNKDIDNLVRVAATAVERPLGLRGTSVELIEASKERQSADQPCGLFVRAWGR